MADTILTQTFVILFFMGIGLASGRFGCLKEEAQTWLASFVMTLSLPAAILLSACLLYTSNAVPAFEITRPGQRPDDCDDDGGNGLHVKRNRDGNGDDGCQACLLYTSRCV